MPYQTIDELCLYEIIGCPVILPDKSVLGYVEGLKRHKGGCHVWLLRTDDDREIQLPIYEQLIVECNPYESLYIDPPADLLEMFRNGQSPENPCEIAERETDAHRLKAA